MLRTVHGTVLSARATEREHKVGETTLHIAFHMVFGEFVDRAKKFQDFAVVFQEANNRLVESRNLLIRLVTTRVVRAATVENVASTIARSVFRNTVFERKAKHPHHQRAFSVVLREGCGAVQWVCLVHIFLGNLVTVGSVLCWLFDMSELW